MSTRVKKTVGKKQSGHKKRSVPAKIPTSVSISSSDENMATIEEFRQRLHAEIYRQTQERINQKIRLAFVWTRMPPRARKAKYLK